MESRKELNYTQGDIEFKGGFFHSLCYSFYSHWNTHVPFNIL